MLAHRIFALGVVLLGLAGCGLQVSSPDLFLLRRTGSGHRLSLLVNDAGTVRCDGGPARTLPPAELVDARQLAQDLQSDAANRLRVAPAPGSVATYTVRLEGGTITFADTAGSRHPELARAELLAQQIASGPCVS